MIKLLYLWLLHNATQNTALYIKFNCNIYYIIWMKHNIIKDINSNNLLVRIWTVTWKKIERKKSWKRFTIHINRWAHTVCGIPSDKNNIVLFWREGFGRTLRNNVCLWSNGRGNERVSLIWFPLPGQRIRGQRFSRQCLWRQSNCSIKNVGEVHKILCELVLCSLHTKLWYQIVLLNQKKKPYIIEWTIYMLSLSTSLWDVPLLCCNCAPLEQ